MITFLFDKYAFLRKTVSVILVSAFFASFVMSDAWAVVMLNNSITGTAENDTGSESFSAVSADTFALPEYLGEVKESFKGNSGRMVIHIQDAHCNSFAQKKISELIGFINNTYGTRLVNLEGASGDYDMTIFTGIADGSIREKVSEHFLNDGQVNGAEFYAVNHPGDLELWGVEDKDLYLANLEVYRDSLAHKEEIDRYLAELTHILNNLKRHIYTPELLEMAIMYGSFKTGNMDFKDYFGFITKKAALHGIDLARFSNVLLLEGSIEGEGDVDFRRATVERSNITDELNKRMSKNEKKQLLAKALDFQLKKMSKKSFYGYLVKKAGESGIDPENYPELLKYINYVSTYETIDKSSVMEELDKIEREIKEKLYGNDEQRRLDILSRNLVLLKNIFGIAFTRPDYRYYLDNKDSFDIANYLAFIEKEAPLFRIGARPDEGIIRLDTYRENLMKFYEYSFKRDEAFLKNLRFQGMSDGAECAVLMTGGFHSENLYELLRKENISYISILPKFTSGKAYKSPYFGLLGGQLTDVQQALRSAIANISTIAVASMLSSGLARDVWGRDGVEAFNTEAALMATLARLAQDNPEGCAIEVKDGERTVVVLREGSEASDNRVVVDLAQIIDMVQDIFIDSQIAKAYEEGKVEKLEDSEYPGAREEAAQFLDALTAALRVENAGAAGQIQKVADSLRDPTKNIALLTDSGITGFVAHAGGMGIHINKSGIIDKEHLVRVIVHEAIAQFSRYHEVSAAVEGLCRVYQVTGDINLETLKTDLDDVPAAAIVADPIGILSGAGPMSVMRETPLWGMTKEERRKEKRDIAEDEGTARGAVIEEARPGGPESGGAEKTQYRQVQGKGLKGREVDDKGINAIDAGRSKLGTAAVAGVTIHAPQEIAVVYEGGSARIRVSGNDPGGNLARSLELAMQLTATENSKAILDMTTPPLGEQQRGTFFRYVAPYTEEYGQSTTNTRIMTDAKKIFDTLTAAQKGGAEIYVVPWTENLDERSFQGLGEQKMRGRADRDKPFYRSFSEREDVVVRGGQIFITERLVNAIFTDHERWLDKTTELAFLPGEEKTLAGILNGREPGEVLADAEFIAKLNPGEKTLLIKAAKRAAYTPERILLAVLMGAFHVMAEPGLNTRQKELNTLLGLLDPLNIRDKVWANPKEDRIIEVDLLRLKWETIDPRIDWLAYLSSMRFDWATVSAGLVTDVNFSDRVGRIYNHFFGNPDSTLSPKYWQIVDKGKDLLPLIKETIVTDVTDQRIIRMLGLPPRDEIAVTPVKKRAPETRTMTLDFTVVNADPKLTRMAERLANSRFQRFMTDGEIAWFGTDNDGRMTLRGIASKALPTFSRIFAYLINRINRVIFIHQATQYYVDRLRRMVGEDGTRDTLDPAAIEDDIELRQELLHASGADMEAPDLLSNLVRAFDNTDDGELASLATRRENEDEFGRGAVSRSLFGEGDRRSGLTPDDIMEAGRLEAGIRGDIEGLVTRYIRGDVTDEGFESEAFGIKRTVRDYLARYHRGREAEERVAFLGANFLRKAKAAKASFEAEQAARAERGEAPLSLGLNMSINFNNDPGDVDINTRTAPSNALERFMINAVERVQGIRYLRALSSPLFMGLLLGITLNGAVMFARALAKLGAVSLVGFVLPLAISPYIIALGIGIVMIGIWAGARANAEILMKKDAAEARDVLGTLSNERFDAQVRDHLVRKIDVIELNNRLGVVLNSLRGDGEMRRAMEEQELDKRIGEVLYYLSEFKTMDTLTFRSRSGDEVAKMERAKTELLRRIDEACVILAGVSVIRPESEDARNARNTAMRSVRQRLISDAKEGFDREIVTRENAFQTFKTGQVLMQSGIAMVFALLTSFIMVEFTHLLDAGAQPVSVTKPEVKIYLARDMVDARSIGELDRLLSEQVDKDGLVDHLVEQGFDRGIAAEKVNNLFDNGIARELTRSNESGFANMVQDYVNTHTQVTIALSPWSNPTFVKEFCETPGFKAHIADVVGKDRVDVFLNEFQKEMGEQVKGKATMYETLQKVLDGFGISGHDQLKAVESAINEAMWDNPIIRANLADIFINNGYLRSPEFVKFLFEGDGNWAGTLERVKDFIPAEHMEGFTVFSNESERLYQKYLDAAQGAEKTAAMDRLMAYLEENLWQESGGTAGLSKVAKMHIAFDWIHRLDIFQKTQPATGELATTFYEQKRAVLSALIEQIKMKIIPGFMEIPKKISRLGPSVSETVYGRMGRSRAADPVRGESFVGKVTDEEGALVDTSRISVSERESNGRKVLELRNDRGEVLVQAPLTGKVLSAPDMIARLSERFDRVKDTLPTGMRGHFENLLEGISGKVDKIVLLQHTADNPDMFGFFNGGELYVNEFLADNPLMFMHEVGEGFLTPPDGVTRHTLLRGPGKDARGALRNLVREGALNNNITANELINILETELEKMARQGNISKTRIDNKGKGIEEGLLTESEKSFIRYKYSLMEPGEAIDWTKILYGMQDYLDPAGNAEFSANIRLLKDDLVPALNIFIVAYGDPEARNSQESIGREAGDKFRREVGINSILLHYDASEENGVIDKLRKGISEGLSNPGKIPNLFVQCFTDKDVAAVNEFLNNLEVDEEYKKLSSEKREAIRDMVVVVRDTLPEGARSVGQAKINDTKVMAIGNLILNDHRLSVNFKRTPEELEENRRNMISAFQASGIVGDIGDISTASRLDAVMRDLYSGQLAVQITAVNWEEITDYRDSMQEVLRSL